MTSNSDQLVNTETLMVFLVFHSKVSNQEKLGLIQESSISPKWKPYLLTSTNYELQLDLSRVYRYTKGNWPQQISQCLRPFYDRRHELTVEEGCILWGYRVIVPKVLREKLLQELHKDHPGVIRMKSVGRSFMWWPGLDKDIENRAKSCQSCQAVKRAPPVAPLHPWVWPSKPWQRESIWILLGHFKDPCSWLG